MKDVTGCLLRLARPLTDAEAELVKRDFIANPSDAHPYSLPVQKAAVRGFEVFDLNPVVQGAQPGMQARNTRTVEADIALR
ncbi:MAG TPA: hypothetical protein VGQ93_14725 [Lysobacter sp.]|nr:hypothetical protein [Lysobacter sp.]